MSNQQQSTSSSALVKATALITINLPNQESHHASHDRTAPKEEAKSSSWRSPLSQRIVPALSQIKISSARIARTIADISIATAGDALSSVGTACQNAAEYCQDKQSHRS
jgi:hypothetical protein